MFNIKLNPHTTNASLKVIQVLCILTVFLAAYRAMSLTGPAQISKALVSYLAFVMFLVIDMYRHKKFPWIS